MDYDYTWDDGRIRLAVADCRTLVASLPDMSVDAVVTDPPYELNFMNEGFDRTGIAFDTGLWRDILRTLKPGGHLLAFGATRTIHRVACAIEDAGFEIRDQIDWVYASGMPHGTNGDVAVRHAPAAMARRAHTLDATRAIRARMEELGLTVTDLARAGGVGDTMASHWIATGEGAQPIAPSPERWERLRGPLRADDALERLVRACHAPAPGGRAPDANEWRGWATQLKPAHEPIVLARRPLDGTLGENLLAYGTGALHVDAARVPIPEGERAAYENAFGHRGDPNADKRNRVFGRMKRSNRGPGEGRFPPNMIVDAQVAATSRACRTFPVIVDEPKAPGSERPDVDGLYHPTVKPLALMRRLVRLACPPDGLVLEPFAGSGTTLQACRAEGMRCVASEMSADYARLVARRMSRPVETALPLGE